MSRGRAARRLLRGRRLQHLAVDAGRNGHVHRAAARRQPRAAHGYVIRVTCPTCQACYGPRFRIARILSRVFYEFSLLAFLGKIMREFFADDWWGRTNKLGTHQIQNKKVSVRLSFFFLFCVLNLFRKNWICFKNCIIFRKLNRIFSFCLALFNISTNFFKTKIDKITGTWLRVRACAI